jgi:4-amino-4-deoxy-L-arabinose transferase-like glycosyltransferase
VRILSIPRARETALVAALVLAIHPNAVAYSRLGLSYNLLAPIVLLAVAAAYRFLHGGGNRSLFLAGLLIGLGTVTDLEVLVVLPPLLLIALYRGWRPALRLLAAALILPGLYVVYMLATAPQAFLFDLQFTFSLFFTLPVLVQLAVAIANFGGLLRWDPWLIPSLIGLFMLRPMRVRWFLLLCFMLPLLLVARSVLGLPLRTYHYLIPILPLAAVGTSYLLVQGVLVVAQTFHEGVARLAAVWKLIGRSRGMDWAVARLQHWTGALAVFLFVVSPFLISTMLLYGDIQRQLKTPAEALLVDQSEARQVAAYLNARTAADDLVIASPALAWLLTARVADFQLALAYEGKPTVHFPANIPPERFAYPISPDRARFVVIDPVWRNWAAVEMPEVAKLVAEVETWPVAFAAGEVTVYANPAVRTP